jgi:hypothetical protein
MNFAMGQESQLTDKVQRIENEFSVLKDRLSVEGTTLAFWTTFGGLLTGIATAVLVVILIIQTRKLEKSTQLGSGPKIFPRYITDPSTNITRIYIYNVGKSAAIDVHLEFTDEQNNPIGLCRVDRYSLTTIDVKTYDPQKRVWRPELVETGISFEKEFKFRVKGWYKDLNEDRENIDQLYTYPPSIA